MAAHKSGMLLLLLAVSVHGNGVSKSQPATRPSLLLPTGASGGFPYGLFRAEVSEDGRRIAFLTYQKVRILDAESGKELWSPENTNEPILKVHFSPDGTRLAVMTSGIQNGQMGGRLRIFDLVGNRLVFDRQESGLEGGLTDAVFSGNSKILLRLFSEGLSPPEKGHVDRVDVETGKIIGPLGDNHVDWVWSKGGSKHDRICSAGFSAIRVWNLTTGELKKEIPLKNKKRPLLMSVDDDAAELKAVFDDGTVAIWNVTSGERVSTIEPQELIRGVPIGFSPDGDYVLVSWMRSIRFFALRSGRETARYYPTPPGSVASEIARNGRFVILVNNDPAGEAAIVTLPPPSELPPVQREVAKRGIGPRQAAPRPEPTTAPVDVGPVNPAVLTTAQWWCEAAQAETKLVKDAEARSNLLSTLSVAKARLGDARSSLQLLREAEDIRAPQQASGRTRFQVAHLIAESLSRSGRISEVLALRDELAASTDALSLSRITGDIAVGQAEAGHMADALSMADGIPDQMRDRVFRRMVRRLVESGNLDGAKALLDHCKQAPIADELRRPVAVALASRGQVDAALELAKKFNEVDGVSGGTYRWTVFGEMAGAAEAADDDRSAWTVVANTPEKYRGAAMSSLGAEQIKRGNLWSAAQTLTKLGKLPEAYKFRQDLAVAHLKVGEFDAAEEIGGPAVSYQVFYYRFQHLLRTGQFEAAADQLNSGEVVQGLETQLRLSLATAMLAHGNMHDAEKLYDGRKADPGYKDAQLLVATAYLKAGDLKSYNSFRDPIAAKLSGAKGAPSRVAATRELWAFDILTGNFPAAAKELEGADIEEKGFVMGLAPMIDARMESGDFGYARDFAAAIPTEMPRARAWFVGEVATRHAKAGKTMELVTWIKSLPTAEQRATAYLSAAEALTPADSGQPEY